MSRAGKRLRDKRRAARERARVRQERTGPARARVVDPRPPTAPAWARPSRPDTGEERRATLEDGDGYLAWLAQQQQRARGDGIGFGPRVEMNMFGHAVGVNLAGFDWRGHRL
jgi:hypothetical protein